MYKKEYIKTYHAPLGGAVLWRQETDRELAFQPSLHEERGSTKEWISQFLTTWHEEHWKMYIAKCPNEEQRSANRIERECKTAFLDVSKEIYASSKIGQEFKKPE